MPEPPYHVGERPQPRSMYPIRDASNKVVAYSPSYDLAQRIASLLNEQVAKAAKSPNAR